MDGDERGTLFIAGEVCERSVRAAARRVTFQGHFLGQSNVGYGQLFFVGLTQKQFYG